MLIYVSIQVTVFNFFFKASTTWWLACFYCRGLVGSGHVYNLYRLLLFIGFVTKTRVVSHPGTRDTG